jgi:hypothetical protein
VEVQLISKQDVLNFLQTQESAIQNEIDSRKKEYDAAKDAEAKAAADSNSFETNGSLAEARQLETQFQSLTETNNSLNETLGRLGQERDELWNRVNNFGSYENVAALKTFDDRHSADMSTMSKEWASNCIVIPRLKFKIDQLEADGIPKEEHLQSQLFSAQTRLKNAKSSFENYPTPEAYLTNFIPPVIQKSLTDADGKFSLAYSGDKELAIFAHAQRLVGDATEKYYWLVNAPTNEQSQIFLSNNSLVTVDPDGYFKIKPIMVVEKAQVAQTGN